jgi:flagellar biosynthetic protein FlhB
MAQQGDDAQERTHEPTDKRRKKFRDKGEVPRSKEVTSTIGLAIATVVLVTTMQQMTQGVREIFTICFRGMTEGDLDLMGACFLLGQVSMSVAAILTLPLFLLWLAALLVGLIQGQGVIPKEPLKFDLEKLNPLPGFQKLFMSSTPLVELGKGLLKLGLIAWLVWTALEAELGLLPELTHMSIWDLLDVHGQMALMVVVRAMPVALIISVLDYGYQWYQLQEKMMMTREEVKEEHKDMEGDPHMRAARRARAREIASVKAVRNVHRADVVVTNPTHYAVALSYNADEAPAPIVIARGVDHLALKIKQEARRHDVPVIENRVLARALYAESKEGQMIPESLYAAVAQVLAVILRRRNARARTIQRYPGRPQV